MSDVLTLDGVAAGYGEVTGVFDATFSVRRGEVVALLGPNGAGKTTTLLAIMGFLPTKRGKILGSGRDMSGVRPHARARAGWIFVPDDRALIPGLTVSENLSIVRHVQSDPYELFPELVPLRSRRAGLLSGGEQQMLALARALCTRPELLLVDELSLGLAPKIVGRLLDALRSAADEIGTGVVLVEQQVERALQVSDHAHVLVRGSIRLSGTAAELLEQRGVVEATYLGDHGDEATAESSVARAVLPD